ncbi:MAG: argininosuccinate lyase [Candidatus Caldarchaeum sp.]
MEAPHRGGMLKRPMDEKAAIYTSSASFDHEIIEATVYVNAAHIKALAKLGVISQTAALDALQELKSFVEKRPQIPATVEDVHIFLESLVSRSVPEVGEMLALGKSRNDAVVAAIKIEAKRRIYGTSLTLLNTVESLLQRSLAEAETVFPVYTHLQRAAPATFGFLLQAYAVRFLRGVHHLLEAVKPLEESPLGSAAVAGTSVPLDRKYLAEILGFKTASVNALEATAARDFLIPVLSALLQTSLVLSSFAEELVLYCSDEFGFLTMPDEYSATSSIMPQKRNPVVAEIMRTKVGEILGLLCSVSMILGRQPSGYSLDLQQTTPKLWKAFEEIQTSMSLLGEIVKDVRINAEKALRACGPPAAAVEVANHLTLSKKLPFRKAHQIAGKISAAIASGGLDDHTLKQIFSEHGLDSPYEIDEILNLMEPTRVVRRYAVAGSANPAYVREAGYQLLKQVADLRDEVDRRSREFENVLMTVLE